ncbi:MAG: ribosome-associated protein [Pseudohongiellaceae bacterium]|jgi:ribosome-associated protein
MVTKDTQADIPTGFKVVEISRQPVELYKVLKFEGLVGSGGEAKTAVAAGLVTLNGEVETQKRKKIVAGDSIEFGAEKLFVVLGSLAESNPRKPVVTKPRPVVAANPPVKRPAIILVKRGK